MKNTTQVSTLYMYMAVTMNSRQVGLQWSYILHTQTWKYIINTLLTKPHQNEVTVAFNKECQYSIWKWTLQDQLSFLPLVESYLVYSYTHDVHQKCILQTPIFLLVLYSSEFGVAAPWAKTIDMLLWPLTFHVVHVVLAFTVCLLLSLPFKAIPTKSRRSKLWGKQGACTSSSIWYFFRFSHCIFQVFGIFCSFSHCIFQEARMHYSLLVSR